MQRRQALFRRGFFLVALAYAMLCWSPPALAQGFLEGLFGMFAPKPKPRPPEWSAQRSTDFGDVRANPFDVRRAAPSRFGGGRYKTMCVRLCDGFYFPISNAAPRRAFWRDADLCQSRCDSETALFYMPTDGGSIEQARSLTGLAYEDLKNAFRYRKTLDASCTCRPEPWSVAERERHTRYALIDAGKADPAAAAPTGQAGGASDPRGEARDVASAVTSTGPDGAGSPLGVSAPPAVTRQRPVRVTVPAYGLGGPAGLPSPAVVKPARKKPSFRSHWPGTEGN